MGILRAQRLTRRPRRLQTPCAPAALATRPPSVKSATGWSGILHDCLKTRTLYDERTAWEHHLKEAT